MQARQCLRDRLPKPSSTFLVQPGSVTGRTFSVMAVGRPLGRTGRTAGKTGRTSSPTAACWAMFYQPVCQDFLENEKHNKRWLLKQRINVKALRGA